MTSTRSHTSADHGDVVADEQERGAVVAVTDRRSRSQHLLLHGDVEGGGRLVGDDQRGLPIRPMPIMARWRMPPENSCGYCRARALGLGMRTARSRSTARAVAGLAVAGPGGGGRPRRAARRSACVGLNEVIGSWKTTASEVPSSSCCVGSAARAGRCRRSASRSRARPGRAPRRAGRSPARSATCRSPTRRPRRRPRRCDAEGDAADRPDRAVAPGEGDPQVPHVEHRRPGSSAVVDCACSSAPGRSRVDARSVTGVPAGAVRSPVAPKPRRWPRRRG